MSAATPAALVVFDLDGTLIDSSRDLAAALNQTLDRLHPGTPALSVDEVRAMIGDGALKLITRALRAVGLRDAPQDALPVFLDCYRVRLLEETRLYPGVLQMLEALASRHLAVLTNKPGDFSRVILEGLEVARFFRRVYGGGDLPAKKPDPVGLQRLLAEAGVTPDRAVMVGDSAIDVRTGRAAGVRTIGARYGFDVEGLRQEPPDLLVDDPRDLIAIV
jgi:phosphoglycolate phosphatase